VFGAPVRLTPQINLIFFSSHVLPWAARPLPFEKRWRVFGVCHATRGGGCVAAVLTPPPHGMPDVSVTRSGEKTPGTRCFMPGFRTDTKKWEKNVPAPTRTIGLLRPSYPEAPRNAQRAIVSQDPALSSLAHRSCHNSKGCGHAASPPPCSHGLSAPRLPRPATRLPPPVPQGVTSRQR